MIVNEIKQAVAKAIRQLIVHKVHRPHLIWALWLFQGLGFVAIEPYAPLNPEIQGQLTVNTINALMIPWEAFDIAQVVKTRPKPPVSLSLG